MARRSKLIRRPRRRVKQPALNREQAIQELMSERGFWSRFLYQDQIAENPTLAPFPIRERRRILDEVHRRENAETHAEREQRLYGGQHGR